MSDEDAPYKHTRHSDLKRKPLRKMELGGPSTSAQSPKSQAGSVSASKGKSPKSSPGKSPAPGKKSIYPELKTDEKGIYPVLSDDVTDSSRLDTSQSSHDGSFSNLNWSGQKVRSPPKKEKKSETSGQRTTRYTDAVPESSNNFNTILIIGVVVLILAAFVMLNTPDQKVLPDKTAASEVFLKNLREIKSVYPAQNARFWKIIGSQVKRVLSNDSTYPAVILLGTPEGHAGVGTCLSKKVVSAVNDAVKMAGGIYIDVVSLDQTSPDKTKFSLDETLKNMFDESKGAIIDHVEKLPAKAALLLHGYCDGDNAPYKDVVLFLLFHTTLSKEDLNDKVVEKSLQELWGKELGVDEMPALCSRIANNIVVLSPEDNEALSTC